MPDIRAATVRDTVAIRALLEAAFPTGLEADLVERLQADGDGVISLVACEQGSVVGHILFTRMQTEADGRKLAALGLAPVAVRPDRQRRGIGSNLIEAGVREAAALGADIIFVLGEPAFYGRFGFAAATARPFKSPYAGPYLQALIIAPDFQPPVEGTADYAPAFAESG